MEGRIAINDLDIISVINLAERRQRRYLAILLNDVEEVMKNPKLSEDEKYKHLRKAILDNVNELKRAWLRDVFSGDVEGTGII
jgi:hypothetical protein